MGMLDGLLGGLMGSGGGTQGQSPLVAMALPVIQQTADSPESSASSSTAA